MLIQFLAFPPLARHYGVLRCLKWCSLTFPLIYIVLPFTALLSTPLTQQVGVFVVMLFKCWCSIFAFPCTTILLTNSAVSLRVLGTLNGVATSVSAIGRAAGPAIGGGTFSWGVKRGYVILPWWTLAFLSALGAIPVFWLVEMDGFGGADVSDSEDDEEDEEDAHAEDRGLLAPHGNAGEAAGATSPTDVLVGDDLIPESHVVATEDSDELALEDESSLPVARTSKTEREEMGARLTPRAAGGARMTSPLGMRDGVGPGGGRRLSNGLGTTRSGFGAGGTSYH